MSELEFLGMIKNEMHNAVKKASDKNNASLADRTSTFIDEYDKLYDLISKRQKQLLRHKRL